MKQILLYGLSGAVYQYRAVAYYCIYEETVSIAEIKYQAETMRLRNPGVKQIYAIDNRTGLRREYTESYRKNTIESCAIFKDTLEREGMIVI